MTRETRPLGAQISHMLKDRGVEVIFGVPGVHNQEMYRGIEEAGLRHVLSRHEQGAGFMADGYARATGKTGVCYVISGPGLCNIMTPMGQAYSDSVSMLVISSCLDETSATRGQLHQMRDQEGAARTVCDWSETARTADAAYHLIDRALGEFETGRARPKHLTVPIKALEGQAPQGWSADRTLPANLNTPVEGALRLFAEALGAARRPVFILGGGAAAAAEAIRPVLKKAQAASFVTYAGRGIVNDDPLHFGALLARGDSAEVLASADLLISVGTDLSEVDLWRTKTGATCRHIRINIDGEILARRSGEDVSIACDAGLFFASLAPFVAEGNTDWTAAEVSQFTARMRAQIDAERPGIGRVADALRAAIPADTMIYSDMTQFAYAAKEIWPMDRPGHWHHPYGFGTLGYALPAAIGGAVARPGQPTMAIAGDYGFQYTIQELGTAVELGLPLPIILWDNGKLGEIEAGMIRAQIAPNAVVQRNPDFCKLAEAYGARAEQPADLAALADAVQRAFTAEVPTLIRVTPDIG
ncbi:thiamine pyrophosphate-binding protein [Flavimaricola marinus]|uniref:Putative 2-ketoarginine decarboxylase AruI n=1 Tax=Flavimaricola marinus TaxID=1819565 RepID=A0A238LGC4_9RHOB|nr:thiamine pyrophosphate-binding protein [Flavimaricola marinus]SMY08668.1 putative 2-ketoarginine decarboxylase AruI [Flavimaricola marinus]